MFLYYHPSTFCCSCPDDGPWPKYRDVLMIKIKKYAVKETGVVCCLLWRWRYNNNDNNNIILKVFSGFSGGT